MWVDWDLRFHESRTRKGIGVGVTKTPFIYFLYRKVNFNLAKVLTESIKSYPYLSGVTAAAVTPVKYEHDIQWITSDFMILKNLKNNEMGRMSLVTSTPDHKAEN